MSCKIQVNSVCFVQHVTPKINVNNSKSCSYRNGRVKTFFLLILIMFKIILLQGFHHFPTKSIHVYTGKLL